MEPASTTVAVTALTSLIGWVGGLSLSEQLITGPVGNWAHQAVEAARRKSWGAVATHFTRGRLPPNHHVARACRAAMGETLAWMARELRQALPADLQLEQLRRLEAGGAAGSGPLDYRLPAAQRSWLDALERLARDDAALQALEEVDTHSRGVQQMLQSQADPDAAGELHGRIDAWLRARLHGQGEPPEGLACFLSEGWPMAQPGGRLTLYQAWCWHFREKIKEQPAVFNSFVASALADLLQTQRQAPADPPIDYAEAIGRHIDTRLAELLQLTRSVAQRTVTIAATTARSEVLARHADASLRALAAAAADGSERLTSVHQLLEQVFRIVSAPPPADPAAQPPVAFPVFVGLRAYRRRDAAHFFGRERDIADYLAVVAAPQHQTLLIKGRSGVGKSSLLLAGVLPRLPGRRGAKVRNYLYMAPGSDPLLELVKAIDLRASSSERQSEAALRRQADRLAHHHADLVRLLEREIDSSERRVLYIDQLEELLIDASTDAAHAQAALARKNAFLQGLQAFLDHDPQRNFVVATLREDYAVRKSDEATWGTLTRLFESGPVRWLRTPDHDAILDRMVQGPCEQANFAVDPHLLAALRIDVRGVQGWPPLLSACLEEMVRELQVRHQAAPVEPRLTLAHYQAIGGLQDIVKRRAGFIEGALSLDELRGLPQLFRRLVRIDQASGLPTKDRLALRDIPAELGSLVDQLLHERLLSDEGAIALIHDALFDSWPSLKRWIAGNRETLLDREDFQFRTHSWLELGRPERKLAREDDLGDAFGVPRLGLREALHCDPRVNEWVTASRQAELHKHLGAAAADPEVWRLPTLLREGVRLSAQQIASLSPTDRCFYYALCPEALQQPRAAVASSPAETVSASFGNQAGSGADPLDYFDAAHLPLQTGREARYRLHHFAALGGQVPVLERLRTLGMDLDSVSGHGRSALDMAVVGGHLETVQYLLAQAADPVAQVLVRSTESRRHAVHSATCYGHAAVLGLLLDTVPAALPVDTPDAENWTPLAMAVYHDHRAALERLLQSGRADLAVQAPDGGGLIGLALMQGHIDLAELLLEGLPPSQRRLDESLDPNEPWPPLALAINQWAHNLDQAQRIRLEALFARLLALGADTRPRVTARHQSLLAYAATQGAVPLMVQLLDAGTDVEPDDAGWTALDHAIASGESLAALTLLDRPGWSSRLRTAAAGQDPLLAATRAGLHDVAARILDHVPGEDLRTRVTPAFVVDLLENAAGDSQRVMARGRVIDLLLRAGAPAPARSALVRDPAQRIVGLALQPGLLRDGMDPAWTWPADPVVDGAWAALAPAQAQPVLEALDAQRVIARAQWEQWQLQALRCLVLPWYPDGLLVELGVEAPEMGRGRILVLRAADQWCRLEGRSPVIHEVNARWLRPLDAEQALDYLDFFCAAVHGDHGAFRILRRPERMTWAPTAPPAQRERVHDLWRAPVAVAGEPDQHTQDFSCHVKYANALFIARMQVLPGGMCKMHSDEPVAAELDTWDEQFIDRVLQVAPPRAPAAREPAAADAA